MRTTRESRKYVDEIYIPSGSVYKHVYNKSFNTIHRTKCSSGHSLLPNCLRNSSRHGSLNGLVSIRYSEAIKTNRVPGVSDIHSCRYGDLHGAYGGP